MFEKLKGPWVMKVGGILIIAAIEWMVGQALNKFVDSIAKMNDIDKVFWGVAVFILMVGIFLFFFPIIEKWMNRLGDKKQAEVKTEADDKSVIEFYCTRKELAAKRGVMPEELGDDRVKKLWVAWWTGRSAYTHRLQDSTNIQRRPPIDKMILINPDGHYIHSHAFIEDAEIHQLKEEILRTSQLFRNKGVQVRFFDGYIEAMIIADNVRYNNEDEFSDNAWIRVEPGTPYKDTINACNYVIYKRNNKQLFEALIGSYKFLWNKSTVNPAPDIIQVENGKMIEKMRNREEELNMLIKLQEERHKSSVTEKDDLQSQIDAKTQDN